MSPIHGGAVKFESMVHIPSSG